MNINNFVIDHVLRGIMTSTADGSYMWSINQITDPSLNITSETADAVDALGSVIASFNRGKNAEFSANNSMFDLGLFAAQNGREKEIASEDATIIAPALETIVYDGTDTPVALKHTPTEAITEIFLLNGDDTLGQVYKANTAADASSFVYNADDNTITLPTGLTKGVKIFVMYQYEMKSGVAVTGTATDFPKAGKFVLEVLGTDVCDTTTLIHAYLVFPNAKLDANVDITFATDGNHPFTIKANQSYCDPEKRLFYLVIPEEE